MSAFRVVGLAPDSHADSGVTATVWDVPTRREAFEFAAEVRDRGEYLGGVRVYKRGQKDAIWIHETAETQAWIRSLAEERR